MFHFSLYQTKQWLKQSHHPLAKTLFARLQCIRRFEVPAPKILTSSLYHLHCGSCALISTLLRLLWWTPLFKGRLQQVGHNLYLYGGLPYISGPLTIQLGSHCRISGQSTFSARTCGRQSPLLQVGDNVDIGWMTTIAVGTQVHLGNNVRIAGRAFLAGYPGHPLDPRDRAAGLPDTDAQIGKIVLQEDVWLATGVSVMAGVTIGRGTIVAAGSVVTGDLPPMVLAGGVPAKVIRPLCHRDGDKGAG